MWEMCNGEGAWKGVGAGNGGEKVTETVARHVNQI